jgi:alpha-amylase
MDDLDGNPRLQDLFPTFWAPLLASLRKINPRLKFVAEQADWGSFGFDYFSKAILDRVFAFRLAFAIASFNKRKLEAAADTTLGMLPPGKEQVVFIENHDMDRFASRVNLDPGKERVGAVLNLLLGGIPAIYYGQELGMFGTGGNNKYGSTDANDIPRREAFEWYAADTGKGMALWYKNSGPWWDSTNLKPFDGVSLEEEQHDPGSLFNWYRSLLTLRREHPALEDGRYAAVKNSNEKVFSWARARGGSKTLWIAVNLSDQLQQAVISQGPTARIRRIFGNATGAKDQTTGVFSIGLPAYGVGVWESE